MTLDECRENIGREVIFRPGGSDELAERGVIDRVIGGRMGVFVQFPDRCVAVHPVLLELVTD